MAEKLFSVNEAAAILSIKPKTLYARIASGDAHCRRIFGWTIRLSESDIQEIMTGTGSSKAEAAEAVQE